MLFKKTVINLFFCIYSDRIDSRFQNRNIQMVFTLFNFMAINLATCHIENPDKAVFNGISRNSDYQKFTFRI